MKLYFAYGANLNIDNMSRRCPDAVTVQPFYLRNWRLSFSGVATIQPSQDNYVAGALWAISESDERALDDFEGYPYLYRKEIIQSDGLEFMVYVMNQDPPGEPGVNYLLTIAQGYQDWNLDIEDLADAVYQTQQEEYHNDLHRSSTTNDPRVGGTLSVDLQLQSSHDLRHVCDHELAHRDPAPF
jgi:gamma-glutamylcyclotransferase (GGCT)/AIG2-like uncharacterized protein YtfP